MYVLPTDSVSGTYNTSVVGYIYAVNGIIAPGSQGPFRQKDIDKLEKIQRSAARFVTQIYRQTASVTSLWLTKSTSPFPPPA